VAEHHKTKDKIEIYDPTSGSGSLLLTIGKSVGRHIQDKNHVKYYAQELKENTYNLTRMNLVMRGISPSNIDTRCADSLDEDWPIQKAGPQAGMPLYVDAVVSNPPYSQHWEPEDAELDARFKDYGVAPKSKADYAFLLHELHHLKPDGIMTIVLPHGVLFRGSPDDGAEGQIRQRLIEKNQIDAIIGLPANIFFGTGIPTLIMVLKQHRDCDDVLIIDASKGFVKDGRQNKLRASDIKRVADTWRSREEIPGFSRRVSRDMIRENGYNLNIPRYVDSSEAPEQYDIYATMFGGIPNSEIDQLQKYWDVLPEFKERIFKPVDGKPYSLLTNENLEEIAKNSHDMYAFWHQYFKAFVDFAPWMGNILIDHMMEVKEMEAHDQIATEIFRRMEHVPIIDPYDIYQMFSDQWPTIINDIEVLQTEGVDAARAVEPAMKLVKKGDEEIEVEDGMKGRVIPFGLVQEEEFNYELRLIDDKVRREDEIASEVEEIRDSFTEDENQEYLNEKENLDTSKIKKDAKAKGDDIESETKEKLKKLVALWDEKSKLDKALKAERKALEEKTVSKIQNLTDKEVEIFLGRKWITPVMDKILDNVDNPSFIIDQVKALARKYAVSYHDLNAQLVEAQDELSGLITQLEGDESSIEGLNALMNSFKQ
jgi:type I restriction enzyme M protein